MEEQNQENLVDQNELPEVPAEVPGVEEAETVQGFFAGIATETDVIVHDGGAVGIAAGRDISLTDGIGIAIKAGRDLAINDSAAVQLKVNGSAEMTDSAALVMRGDQITAHDSFIGILFSKQTNLSGESRVLLGTKQAAAFGVAVGTAFALFSWLFSRKNRGRCCNDDEPEQ